MTFGNMARWGKGRGTSLAVPLDNLFKENINCPSVARSAGVVGKWGITSFTSIRSAPYAFGSQYVKSQVQDQNSPLTVPVPTPAEEAPKPKKFFKSRNAAPEVPPEALESQDVAPAESPKVTTATYGRKDDKPKANFGKKASKASVKEIPPDKEDIPKLKIHIDKSKHSKKSFVTKASKKEETSAAEVTHLSPNKRYLVRNRNKVINYSEDRSNSPLLREESPPLLPLPTPISSLPLPPPVELPPLKVSTPKVSPSLSSPTYVKPGLMSPTNKDGKPPIVLRISKGTSRLLSTDSEDILGSPNSDRHSAIEPHFETEKVKIASPVSIINSSPKQEGIKITIKLDTKDRASKSKHEKSLKNAEVSEGSSSRPTRASKRNHHHKIREDSNEKSSGRCSSPLPGSDNYELYRTLASPVRDDAMTELSGDDAAQDLSYRSNERTVEDIEMELEHLHSASDDTLPLSKISKYLKRLPVEMDKSPPPEPKPPEKRGGRVMRHRLNINYNEDNNFLDEVTTMRQNRNSAKNYSKKSKRKDSGHDQSLVVISETSQEMKIEEKLLHTLSEDNEVNAESIIPKSRAHSKKYRQSSPELLQTLSDNNVDASVLPKSRTHSKKYRQSSPELLQTLSDNDTDASILPKSKAHTKKYNESSPEIPVTLSEDNEVDSNILPKTKAHSKKYTQISPEILQTSENNEEDTDGIIPKTRVHGKKYRQSSPELLQTLSESNEEDATIVLPKTRAFSKKSNQSPTDLLQILSESNEVKNDVSDFPKTRAYSKKCKSPLEEDSEPVNMSKSPRYTEVQIKSPDRLIFKSPKRICESANSDNDDKPSVKLVIMKKKGSIFKTRAPVNEGGPMAAVKKRQLYKHKWSDDGKGGQTPRREPESETVTNAYDAGPDTEDSQSVSAGGLERITRYRGGSGAITEKPNFGDDAPEPYTSVRCTKGVKEYYTVVRNVKKAHQIQEIGEFQEFNDDVEYILDALQDNNPMATRCLSAITLASKCTAPAFRMHVRAHGTVQKFFCALHDATNDQSLGLCTATVMFVLSQDRLNMDLDRESLELMLNLLESDVSHKNALDDCGLTSAQLAKNKERVRELCAEIKNEGKAKHLDLENITVGNLAMETLLSLTSKRAGEWFKEELRSLGGIDHIVRTIKDCCSVIGFESDMPQTVSWTPQLLDTLRKADRCMKVLENVTQQNEENQLYLVQQGGNSNCISTLARLYSACFREAKTSSDAVVVGALRDTLLPTLKVLVNLSHSFNAGREVVGSSVVGEQMAIFETSLSLMTGSPKIIPDVVDFEFSVCVLLLLINLVQNNISNVQRLIDSYISDDSDEGFDESRKPAIQALIDQFYKREELARLAEQNTDAILDGEKVDEPKEKKMSHDDIMEETVAKLLQKAGVHMEHTMVASYIVLLLGHIASFREDLEQEVRGRLPPHGFQQMRAVLDKYSSFLNLTASGEASSVAHIKATQKIMDFLNRSDRAFDAFNNGQDPVSSSSATDDIQSPASNNPHVFEQSQMSPERLNSSAMSNNVPSEYNTSESDRMSSSMDLDTSFS